MVELTDICFWWAPLGPLIFFVILQSFIRNVRILKYKGSLSIIRFNLIGSNYFRSFKKADFRRAKIKMIFTA